MRKTILDQVHQAPRFRKSIAATVLAVLLTGLFLPRARGDATLTTLASFNVASGYAASGPLTLGVDGNIYGTAKSGGTAGYGTVFKLTPDGTLTALFAFDGFAYGGHPLGGLLQRADGNFYGTTSGDNNTVFKLTPGGTISNLVKVLFNNPIPYANSLIQGADGNLYGTLSSPSGLSDKVFKVSTNNNSVTTFAFGHTATFGYFPNRLVQGPNGNFYGTTQCNDTNTAGMIFQAAPNLTITPLFIFHNTNGESPFGGLALGKDGNFYGTTSLGGVYPNPHFPLGDRDGTAFRFSTNGTFTTLHSFDNTNGAFPMGELLEGKDGNFYGVTIYGGTSSPYAPGATWDGYGTVFALATNGTFTSVFSFDGANGSFPSTGLVQDAAGNLYGTTSSGGDYGYGTIFRLTLSPEPPVFQSVALSGGAFSFTWSSVAGRTYQVQYTSDLAQTNWTNLGGPLTATNSTASASDGVSPGSNRFYRVALLP